MRSIIGPVKDFRPRMQRARVPAMSDSDSRQGSLGTRAECTGYRRVAVGLCSQAEDGPSVS